MTTARITKSLKEPENKKTPATQKPKNVDLEEGSAKLLCKIEIIPDYIDHVAHESNANPIKSPLPK